MNLSSLTSLSSPSSSILTLNPKPSHSPHLPLSNKQKQPSLRPMRVSAISCSTTRTTTVINGSNNSNLYKILSLSSESATMAEIKQAYRSMALRYHPDVCRDTSAKEEWTRMFVQLNAAYETLSDPQLREEYDCRVLGLRKRMSGGSDIEGLRKTTDRWEEQVVELKRRSNRRMGRSWGSSMRAQRMKNRD